MDNSIESVVHAFVQAINRQDLAAMEELMSPAHRFIDSRGNVTASRDQVRAGWVSYFRLVLDYTIEVHETFIHGPVAVLLGTARGSYVFDGKLTQQERWSIPAAFRAFVEDGKVTEWRIYADQEAVRKHLRKHNLGEPHPAGALPEPMSRSL